MRRPRAGGSSRQDNHGRPTRRGRLSTPRRPRGRVRARPFPSPVRRIRRPAAVAPAPRRRRRARAGLRRRGVPRPPRRAPASPELPMATSTLRRKRARPSRLTGLAAKSARNAASSRRASSASGGAFRFVAGGELRLRGPRGRTCSRGRPPGNRRSRRCGCRCPGPQRPRDRSLVLDREVGDAAPGVELVGGREGVGRADVEAGPAGPAMVASPARPAAGSQIGQDRAEEQPRAEFARHQIGVLALPADSGPRRERLLHQRRGVDEHFDVGRPGTRRGDRNAASSLSLPLMTS